MLTGNIGITLSWMSLVLLHILFINPGYSSHLSSHSLRHHQYGIKTKRPTGDIGSNVIANDTEDNSIGLSTDGVVDVIVKQHEEIRLNCHLPDANELPVNLNFGLLWLHDGQTVDTVEMGIGGTGHRYSRHPENGQLLITNVRLEDNGVWVCQFRDPAINLVISSKPIRLIVLDRPKLPYLLIDGRRLDAGNLFIPVKENTELAVTCVVEGGNPKPSIKWVLTLSSTLDQSVISEENDVKSYVELNVTENDAFHNRVYAHTHTTSEARLGNVLRAHHNATVTCLVDHVTLNSPINASLLLDVQYSPSFAISREPGFGFPLREGIPVSLKCDVDSNPPSSPIWQKDDSIPPVAQSGDGYLNFTAIKREHSGWYKCTSHHLLGEFSSIGYFLNIRYDPVVEVTQDPIPENFPTGRQVEVALGGAVQFQCPEDSVGCWSRVGVDGRLEAVGPGPGLALQDILYQDAGEYRCVAGRRGELEKWRSEVNVDLTVRGRPVVYPSNTNITAYTGQTLDFTVEFCANPPYTRAFWLAESGRKLKPGQFTEELVAHNFTPGSSIHCQQAMLTLKEVRPVHEGEYLFLIRSPRGLAEGSVQLNVTQLSGYLGPSHGTRITIDFKFIFILIFKWIAWS